MSLLLACGLTAFATQSFADAKAGEAVVKASDCLVCHAVDKVVVGPALKDIAAKYKGADKATIAKLAEKVKNGVMPGKGVWFKAEDGKMMTPHPALSEADRINAVEWVLAHN